MFSGIIEKVTTLENIDKSGSNKLFTFKNAYPGEIYIDQSISHNGVCLTVVEFNKYTYKVEAIKETLDVTNLDALSVGDIVNLERSVMASSRMDGHIVQGHVDAVAKVITIEEVDGSLEISLDVPEDKSHLIISKGSIALNGISLTVKSINQNLVRVAIIPFTFQYTNIKDWKIADFINVEFDILGKYIFAYMQKMNAR